MSGLIKKDDNGEYWRAKYHEKLKSETILSAEIDRLNNLVHLRERAYWRIYRLLDTVVNRLLRQTIAQMTHAERNQACREISREALQIMQTASDDFTL